MSIFYKPHDLLKKIVNQYPNFMVADQVKSIPRILFHLGLALGVTKPKALRELQICDLGGGVGLFSVACAALGFGRVVLLDDFRDPISYTAGDSSLDLHRSYGVEVISRDLVAKGMADIKGSFDIISSFDSMEHWHHSPKNLFRDAINKIKPGGAFILGVPNCVNLRKRITVPLGIGKWSSMRDWYEIAEFRGHVREPDINDLRYISRDMGLYGVKIYGRNWAGSDSSVSAIRIVNKLLNCFLGLTPSLCSSIYLVGRKSNVAGTQNRWEEKT